MLGSTGIQNKLTDPVDWNTLPHCDSGDSQIIGGAIRVRRAAQAVPPSRPFGERIVSKPNEQFQVRLRFCEEQEASSRFSRFSWFWSAAAAQSPCVR